MPADIRSAKVLPQVNIQFVPSIHNRTLTTLKENVNHLSSKTKKQSGPEFSLKKVYRCIIILDRPTSF